MCAYTRQGILQGIWHWVCACVCVGYHLIDRWAESQCSGLHNQQLYSEHKGLWEERDERSREVQNSKIPGGEEGLPSLLCLFLCFPLNRFSVCVFLGAQVVYLVYFWVCALLCVCMCVFFEKSVVLIMTDRSKAWLISEHVFPGAVAPAVQCCANSRSLIGRTLSQSIKRGCVQVEGGAWWYFCIWDVFPALFYCFLNLFFF